MTNSLIVSFLNGDNDSFDVVKEAAALRGYTEIRIIHVLQVEFTKPGQVTLQEWWETKPLPLKARMRELGPLQLYNKDGGKLKLITKPVTWVLDVLERNTDAKLLRVTADGWVIASELKEA